MNGIINVYKEAGWTSNDVVQKLRGILGTKKVGHGGTLDPAVTGVLPIAVGRATRLLEYMESAGKTYEGTALIGISTETEDAQGEIVEKRAVKFSINFEKEVDTEMKNFLGEITQIPPLYSAVKVAGKRLYTYARKGETVERPSRQVQIYEWQRKSPVKFDETEETASFEFKLSCSKGTYVRTLCVDLSAKLGYPGSMLSLRRTKANGLTIEESLSLSDLQKAKDEGDLETKISPMAVAVAELKKKNLTPEEFEAVSHGKSLESAEKAFQEETAIALFYHAEVVAIYRFEAGKLRPQKVLV